MASPTTSERHFNKQVSRSKSAIEQGDFVQIAKAVDPHIEATGGLAGLIIEAPGSESVNLNEAPSSGIY